MTAADTLATAADLLGLPVPDALGRVVRTAFRRWAGPVTSKGERRLPRGSIRGRVVDPNDRPMAHATVLLVRDEPPDGIPERWADAAPRGVIASRGETMEERVWRCGSLQAVRTG